MTPTYDHWVNANVPQLRRAIAREVVELDYDILQAERKLAELRQERSDKVRTLAEMDVYMRECGKGADE